ncbi:MAG: HAD family hydrolase, partial [Ruminococcus sp.]|nr:HAD family hydrolase [Ruminococcus sp.]
IGRCEEKTLHIDLWLMSCRVLKRDMELAMLDELVKKSRERGIEKIIGYYYRTPKNKMVSELFATFGFDNISRSDNGDTVWCLDIKTYVNKNHVIKVNEKEYSHE